TWLVRDPSLDIRFEPSALTSAGPLVAPEPPPTKTGTPLTALGAVPPFSRKELANGIDLIVFNRGVDHSAFSRAVEIDLVIKTTDLFETDDKAGLSMLTAKALLAGTKARSAFQIENA